MPSLADLLSQTWPARMGKAAIDAFKLPGDVYAGRVAPLSDLGIGRAADLAGTIMGGTFGAGGVPRDALGSAMSNPLYHGSPQKNLSELVPSTRGPLGPGVYTTPAPGVANRYAGGGPVYELPARDRDIYQGAGHRTDAEYVGWKADKQRLLAATEPEKKAEVSALLEKMWSSDGYPLYQRLNHLYKGDEGAQALFKRAGFEGISGQVDGPETMLFGKQALK